MFAIRCPAIQWFMCSILCSFGCLYAVCSISIKCFILARILAGLWFVISLISQHFCCNVKFCSMHCLFFIQHVLSVYTIFLNGNLSHIIKHFLCQDGNRLAMSRNIPALLLRSHAGYSSTWLVESHLEQEMYNTDYLPKLWTFNMAPVEYIAQD